MGDPTLLGVPAVLLVVLLVQATKRLGVRNGATAWVALAIAMGVSLLIVLASDALLTEMVVRPIVNGLLIWLAAIGLYQFRPNGSGPEPMEDKKP